MGAHMRLCCLQVMAVPTSRQGSGVSMHELRLPSSSSVTAHRWGYSPIQLLRWPQESCAQQNPPAAEWHPAPACLVWKAHTLSPIEGSRDCARSDIH